MSYPLDSPVNMKNSLFLKLITTKNERKLMNDIIKQHHSYIQSTITVGRQINYLIFYNGQIIGCIGGQSPPIPLPKPLQDYFKEVAKRTFGDSEEEAYKKALHLKEWVLSHLVNNWKFTLTPVAPHNIGSKVLSVFVKVLPRDWKARYNTEVKWIMTFVGGGKAGTVYKAAGWKFLGYTKGHHFKGALYNSSVVYMRGSTRTDEWVDVEKKKIFIKEIKETSL